jgi:succinate dehydrogenase/fumarate reductase cytochrome b subunit
VKTLLILGFLGVILYHLGAGLYYMLVDKGATRRTVDSLTRRIGYSVLLIALVAAGIASGLIQPHGVGS